MRLDNQDAECWNFECQCLILFKKAAIHMAQGLKAVLLPSLRPLYPLKGRNSPFDKKKSWLNVQDRDSVFEAGVSVIWNVCCS